VESEEQPEGEYEGRVDEGEEKASEGEHEDRADE
jgi:hypothetical protein